MKRHAFLSFYAMSIFINLFFINVYAGEGTSTQPPTPQQSPSYLLALQRSALSRYPLQPTEFSPSRLHRTQRELSSFSFSDNASMIGLAPRPDPLHASLIEFEERSEHSQSGSDRSSMTDRDIDHHKEMKSALSSVHEASDALGTISTRAKPRRVSIIDPKDQPAPSSVTPELPATVHLPIDLPLIPLDGRKTILVVATGSATLAGLATWLTMRHSRPTRGGFSIDPFGISAVSGVADTGLKIVGGIGAAIGLYQLNKWLHRGCDAKKDLAVAECKLEMQKVKRDLKEDIATLRRECNQNMHDLAQETDDSVQQLAGCTKRAIANLAKAVGHAGEILDTKSTTLGTIPPEEARKLSRAASALRDAADQAERSMDTTIPIPHIHAPAPIQEKTGCCGCLCRGGS